MRHQSDTIEQLIAMFASLPTIGRKTAQRLVYYILKQDINYATQFSNALLEVKKNVSYCPECFNYTDISPCAICSSLKRDSSVICVVAEPNDVIAVEKTNDFNGKYHVLHGVINPLEGVSPNDLRIKELISRLSNVKEVILALSPSVEGEVTIQYLAKLIKPLDIQVSRIANGVPIGTSIEYADEATLARALSARIELK